jgi:hypothetical protein
MHFAVTSEESHTPVVLKHLEIHRNRVVHISHAFETIILLTGYLHFVDNETKNKTYQLGKVRYVIDYINKKFLSLNSPEHDIVIDGSLVKFHGRL